MSHTYKVPNSDLVIHVNSDWSGNAEIVNTTKPREYFTIDAVALLSGDFERPVNCQLTERELRMATSYAMWTCCMNATINAVESIEVPTRRRRH